MITVKVGRRRHSLGTLVGTYARGVIVSWFARMIFLTPWRRTAHGRIVLLGHALDGNLEAFRRHLVQIDYPGDVYVLIDEPKNYRELAAKGLSGLLSTHRLSHLRRAARAEWIVSSTGPMFLKYWLPARNRPLFVDVWHGVGFKDRIGSASTELLDYDAHFVSSEHVRLHYRTAGAKARVTGYARTDVTLAASKDRRFRTAALAAFGRDADDQIPLVLVAPTWTEADAPDDGVFRAGVTELLASLDVSAKASNFLVAFRGHPNSPAADVRAFERVAVLGRDRFPMAEELLGAVDVLVSDWSSIAIDYLPLNRPVIYLDRPLPTATPAPLSAQDRPGPIVANLTELRVEVERAVASSSLVLREHQQDRQKTLVRAWGDTLDGGSSARYLRELTALAQEKAKR